MASAWIVPPNEEKLSARHVTDSAKCILEQASSRAFDRGLLVVDGSSIVMLALWSLLLWERKVGLAALEQLNVDRFDLARGLNRLLTAKAQEHPVGVDERQDTPVLVKTGEVYKGTNFEALLEPLLQQAEHEAMDLGHDYIGSEHLVLAITRMADASLAALLQHHGVNHDLVKEAVIGLLQQ